MKSGLKLALCLLFSISMPYSILSAPQAPAATDSANPAEEIDKLESFEKFITKGKPKNVTNIKAKLKGLTKEQIDKFNDNHNGFIKAYWMITPKGHFKIQTDWKIHDAVRTACLLDDFMENFITVLEINRSDLLQCEIHLYRSPEEFRRLVASMGLGMGIGGWFRPDQCAIKGFWNPDPMYHHETTLIHECTHLVNYLLRRKWGNPNPLPTWLDEGMAVLFESSYMPWKRRVETGRPPFSRLIYLKNTINNPDLPSDRKWTDMRVLLNYPSMIPPHCYCESWVIVHYLSYRYADSKKKPFTEFKNYWEKVLQGKKGGYYQDFEAFVRERSGQTIDQFLNDAIAYAKEIKLPKTYGSDGKTQIEWEMGFPDNYASKPDAPKEPWFIKTKDPKVMEEGAQGDIAVASVSSIKDKVAAKVEASGEQLTSEYKDFFVPGMQDKLSMIELENKSGTVSFEGDYLLMDVSNGVLPSEVRLKIGSTEEAEISLRIKVDKGSSGIRFSGDKDNFESGYYLGIGNGGIIFSDFSGLKAALAEAKDDNARKEANRKFIQLAKAPLAFGQEYQLVIKLQNKTVTVLGAKGEQLAKFDAKDMKPGAISIHIPPSSKMSFTALKAKKP